MKDSKENHDGHRLRLSSLVENAGIDNLSKIQVVEYFLTYIFPRGDVNPLAHRLLDKFENFGNIIDASQNELTSVSGINERSANKIRHFGEMFYYYSSSRMTKKMNIKNTAEFLDLLEQMLRFQNTESLFLFAFNNKYSLTQKRRFDLKNVREVGMSAFQLFDFIASSKPTYLVIAHNHPGGTALSSKEDGDAVIYIESLLLNFNCKLIDSFIVGEDGIYSEKQNAFVRNFENIENIISLINKTSN